MLLALALLIIELMNSNPEKKKKDKITAIIKDITWLEDNTELKMPIEVNPLQRKSKPM